MGFQLKSGNDPRMDNGIMSGVIVPDKPISTTTIIIASPKKSKNKKYE